MPHAKPRPPAGPPIKLRYERDSKLVALAYDPARAARLDAIARAWHCTVSDVIRESLARYARENPTARDRLARTEPVAGRLSTCRRSGSAAGTPTRTKTVRLNAAEYGLLRRLAVGLGLPYRDVAWHALDWLAGHDRPAADAVAALGSGSDADAAAGPGSSGG